MRLFVGFFWVTALSNVAIGVILHDGQNRSTHERPEEFRLLEGTLATAYQFPWACVLFVNVDLAYKSGDLVDDWAIVSSCSIFSETWVITSMGNLNTDFWLRPTYQLFSDTFPINSGALMIQAGADYAKYYTDKIIKEMDPHEFSQRVGAQELHVLLEPSLVTYLPFADEENVDILLANKVTATNPPNITEGEDEMVYDVVAFAMDSVFIKTKNSFVWSPYVRPIHLWDPSPIYLEKLSFEVTNKMNFMNNGGDSLCYVNTWQPRSKKMRFQEVTYVGIDDCRAAWCNKFPETCLVFPFRNYDICYTAISYGDICTHDKGSALFCKWFEDSVFAIAKHTHNCGFDGTPAVYTLTSAIVRFWNLIMGHDEEVEVEGRPHPEHTTKFVLGDVTGKDQVGLYSDDLDWYGKR